MALRRKNQPEWYSLSHHDRYRKLNKVRRVWGRCHYGKHEDYRGRTVDVNGSWVNDVPSFYLSLGEVINGPNGYFGACLDSLSDCLCGGFGVLPPLTIRLSHYDEVRKALDGRAWCRFHAEVVEPHVAEGDEIELFDCDKFGSYFDAILEVLERGGAQFVPKNEEARE